MTETSNPFDLYNDAPLMYDNKGVPMAQAPFTSTSDTKRYAVAVPPSKVIPVIFVPGIMGSNLRLKKLPDGFEKKRFRVAGVKAGWNFPPVEQETKGFGDIAWRPDNKASFVAQRYYSLEAHERRRLLDPNNTEVDDRAEIPEDALKYFNFDDPALRQMQATSHQNVIAMAQEKKATDDRKLSFLQEMKRRGWGTVMLSSYGAVMGYMEFNLNKMYKRGELNSFWQDNIINRKYEPSTASQKNSATDLGITKGGKPLTTEQLQKAARYWYPVHAVGYNWIQSNRDGGVYLAKKIDEFINHYKSLGYECEKVILVTHSMGGLVARAAAHPAMGKAADKILGVIHNVQPANGAAAAYTRCHQGFEGSGVMGSIAANMLGADGPEVAAVFSNSPGALQLLPNKAYGTGWLEIGDGVTLPKADPYKEIYEERSAWWRLINPEWINPDPNMSYTLGDLKDLWKGYLKNIHDARDFHQDLGTYYHPHTHVSYGADARKFKAFGKVTWRTKGTVTTGKPSISTQYTEAKSGVVHFSDVKENYGHYIGSSVSVAMGIQDEAGDGTVPARSGNAPFDYAELVSAQTGYDHQGSYQDKRVQELTLYSVARLVSENT